MTMQIGKHSYIAFNQIEVLFPTSANLYVGNFCSIAESCVILLGGEHNTGIISTFPFDLKGWNKNVSEVTSFSNGDVRIGNDVWIGKGVKILSGVSIADGAVVGAYSVVAEDIGPYEIWVGNPAKLLKKRFGTNAIKFLLEIRWWDWPDELIDKAVPLLTSNDVEALYRFWLAEAKDLEEKGII